MSESTVSPGSDGILVSARPHPLQPRLVAVLAEFRTFLAPHVPPFHVENCSLEDGSRNPKLNWPGVYVMYGHGEAFKYVGVASKNNCIDKRVWTHERGECDPERLSTGTNIIPFEREFAFLAPALEEFLIRRLQPVANTHGR